MRSTPKGTSFSSARWLGNPLKRQRRGPALANSLRPAPASHLLAVVLARWSRSAWVARLAAWAIRTVAGQAGSADRSNAPAPRTSTGRTRHGPWGSNNACLKLRRVGRGSQAVGLQGLAGAGPNRPALFGLASSCSRHRARAKRLTCSVALARWPRFRGSDRLRINRRQIGGTTRWRRRRDPRRGRRCGAVGPRTGAGDEYGRADSVRRPVAVNGRRGCPGRRCRA